MGFGDDEEKGRSEKRVRNERLGVVRKGVAAAGFVFFDGVFFPVRGCDDVRVDGWVALIFFLIFFGSDKCDGVGGWVGMGLWNAVGCEECTPLCFSAGGK